MFRSIQRNGTTKASNDVVVVCDIVVARSQMFDGAKYIWWDEVDYYVLAVTILNATPKIIDN